MTTYAQGTLIWIKHEEEVWIQAEIVTANDKEIIVKTAEEPDGRIILAPNEPIFLRTNDIFTTEGLSVFDDLTQLTHLHEPAVLSSLQNRFDIDKIYTFTGPILIALNPFKHIPNLYDEDVLKSFITVKPSTKPHVFNTSNAAYRGICDKGKSQTVLISGESGAGKTETTKHVMKFLATAGSEDGCRTDVEKQVLESNPLLEAFGNARTLRNDNSSRFGKFIELQFRSEKDAPGATVNTGLAGENCRLCGARIQTYLLEKVRVCDQQEGERNYHIFYEACAAAASLGDGQTEYSFPTLLPKAKVKEEAKISLDGFAELSNFAYTTRSTCKTLKDVNDIEFFERRIHAMQTIGISMDDISRVLNIIAAVLNLGNTKFDAPPNNSEGSMVMPECGKSMDVVAKKTGVTRAALESALCNQTRVTRTEKIRSPVNVRTASDNRDALAKALYGMLFNFIVSKTNVSIGYRTDVKLFVGVLDIFGFECFKMNSFEQLCINFTNERLQQFFNGFVFKLEEQLYEREGIPWDALDFPDNQDSVDILAAKTTGVFAILDEECMVPQGSDQGFCNKLIKQHKGHRRFDEIKTKPTWFVIKHFAGPVNYCTDSFLDKNKDQLSNDLIECMGSSADEFVANLFKNDPKYADVLQKEASEQKVGSKKKKYTVSSEFKDQLSSLMDIVDLTGPHFIRCIKPNPQNEPDRYDRKAVTEQLRYGGVLQVVQVSRAGYPVRNNHQEFWDEYKIIASPKAVSELKHIDDGKLRAQKLLEHLTTELNIPKPAHGLAWAVGKSMVFFKQQAYERIKFARLELMIKSTTLIQADWRRKKQIRMYKAYRLFTKHIQALLKSKQARIDAEKHRREHAAKKIQSLAKRSAGRKKFLAVLRKIVRIQAWRKGFLGRKYAKEYRRKVSARRIQTAWKSRQEQKVYKFLLRSVHIAQERWRMHYAKQQMKKLKQEAKEVGALMAKNQKAQEQASDMRKKNEELEAQMLQLQSEKKNLQIKVKQIEEQTHDALQQLEAEKAKSEEVAKQAAECAKAKLVGEALEKLAEQLKEKEAVITDLLAQRDKEKEKAETLQVELQRQDKNYNNLLRSSAMQSTSGLGASALPASMGAGGPTSVSAAMAARSAPGAAAGGNMAASRIASKPSSNRNVFIQLVGQMGVGKSSMLEALVKAEDEPQLAKFNEQKQNLMSHHQIQIGERLLKLLDCSGNLRAQHLVREWYTRSIWVFVVYDMANAKSLEAALELAKDVSQTGAKLFMLGNKYNVEQGAPMEADVMRAKDFAVRNEGMSTETSRLIDAIKMVLSANEAEGPLPEGAEGAAGQQLDGLSPDGNRRSSISAAIDSVKSWFGGAAERSSGKGGHEKCLRPSLRGTRAMKVQRRTDEMSADLRAVQELQDSESAVTCIVFGQERHHRNYILLATASKDGTVVIYRCQRTEMELAMLSDQDFPNQDDPLPGPEAADSAHPTNIRVQCRLVGHSRAITSIFFNLLEDQLVTTSIDKSVRFWCIDSSEMLKVFTDSSPVPVAQFLPCNPQVFVAANSNAVLRLVNVANGMVLQKLKVETEVRALKFDDSGMFLLAGTKSGSIHVLECAENSNLKFKFKVQLARGGVTCIHYVPARDGQPPCLLVNTSDSNATIIDMTYGPPAGVLTNLAVRHRVRVAHSLLPLKCTYSPSGQGYLISGSEDKEVYIFALGRGQNYKMQWLKHHSVPVVAVAVNLQDTLLASADSLGHIVMWRRMDYSHLAD